MSTTTPSSRPCRLGATETHFPSEFLQPLFDSRDDFLLASKVPNARAKLQARFAEDGYLFIRGALPRDDVLAARNLVIADLRSRGGILQRDDEFAAPTMEAPDDRLLPRCAAGCIPFLEGHNDLTHHELTLKVLEGEALRGIISLLLPDDEAATTFDFKWLRAAWGEFFTGAHVDRVYMGRGSQRVLTAWVPFGDAPVELGTLAMLQGSHRLPGFRALQSTYGDLDVEAQLQPGGSGWYTSDPAELARMDPAAQWRTEDVRAGDVIVFGMRVLHMSTTNLTQRVRISCDVRWQPASDPLDERYGAHGARDGGGVNQRQKAGAWAVAADALGPLAAASASESAAAPQQSVKSDRRLTMEQWKGVWAAGAVTGPGPLVPSEGC